MESDNYFNDDNEVPYMANFLIKFALFVIILSAVLTLIFI